MAGVGVSVGAVVAGLGTGGLGGLGARGRGPTAELWAGHCCGVVCEHAAGREHGGLVGGVCQTGRFLCGDGVRGVVLLVGLFVDECTCCVRRC